MQEFEMVDLGLVKYFLGIQVKQSKGEIFFSQERYVEDLFKWFHLSNCKPLATPIAFNVILQQNDGAKKIDPRIYRSHVGSVSLVSKFMNKPRKLYFVVAKRILHYLQGSKKFGIKYVKEEGSKLIDEFTNSDWASSLDDRKSTSAYVFCLGSNIVSWSLRKQGIVALSLAY